MIRLVENESDWICIDVCAEQEIQAKAIRAERDKKYGNLFLEKSTDERWVGDLGEIVLNDWLKDSGLKNFQWITQDSAGAADFVIEHGARIGAKTVKRQSTPRMGYTAQISARHAAEPVEWFVFMTSVISQKKVWILGAIESKRFLEEAQYYGAGHKVHENYMVRAGHEIHNISLDRLIAPAAWIKKIVFEEDRQLNQRKSEIIKTNDPDPILVNDSQKKMVVRKQFNILFRPPAKKSSNSNAYLTL